MIRVADLFAGAGGMSTGCLLAAEARGERVELVAVNHWPVSVATHTANHPEARHYCAPVETLDPRVAIPSGKLDLLIAAPECTHHSTARGGKPINDQSRASAWHILRWIELLRVDHVLIENVAEFQTWGPLGTNGRPLKSKRGETFRAFVNALESYGYRVEWKVLNAADFGAATTRKRLFIQARRGKAVNWPKATHSKTGGQTLFGGTKRWRAAREVIDFTLPSQSIFTRKKPLKPATMRRILEGLRRFGGPALEPFLVVLRNNQSSASVDQPLSTICTSGAHHGIAEPCLVQLTHGIRTRSVEDPMPTIVAGHRGELGIVEPFILQPAHGSSGGRGDSGRVHSVDVPLGTQPASNRFALVEPFVLQQQSGGVARPVSEPVPTVATDGAISLVEPFLSKYYGAGEGVSAIDVPVPTVTTRDRFALVQPVVDGYTLDIRFRMLQPAELAGAMSFPKSYVFTGNKGDQIRQIGNAVDCSMSRALCGAILDARGKAAPRGRKAVA